MLAQKGFEVGTGVMLQTSVIANNDGFAVGNVLNFRLTTHLTFGISTGYNFNSHIGLQTGLLYLK